jgi:hypothetical protein
VKSRRLLWAGNVAKRETRNALRILTRKSLGKRSLERPKGNMSLHKNLGVD